ncbi:MAG TPA: hypothetical protein VGQ15_14465 [Gaiellaceae bacterium]|jgi:hypothetical protein|nr:hypothetical protein [Gaiellaceae bacterium]
MPPYRIVFRGGLAEANSDPVLEGMHFERDGDDIVVVGEIVDSAQLHGLLDRIQQLGLELVSVEPEGRDPPHPGEYPSLTE